MLSQYLKKDVCDPFRHLLPLILILISTSIVIAQDPDPVSLMPPKIGSLSHINKYTDRVDNGIRTVTWQYSDPGEDWIHKMRATVDIKHPTSGYTDRTYISQYLSSQNWPTHEVTGWPVGLRSSSATTYDFHTGKAYYNVSVNVIDAGSLSEAKKTADIAYSYILPKIPLNDSPSSQSQEEDSPPDRRASNNVEGRQREPDIPPDPDSYEGLIARMDASIREEKRKLNAQIAEYERQWREAQAEWERKYPELRREGQRLAESAGGTIEDQLELITPRESIELAEGYKTTFPIRLENKSRYTAENLRVQAFIHTRDGELDIGTAKKGLFGGKLGPGKSMTIEFRISKREAKKIIQGYLNNDIHFQVKSIIVWNAAYSSRDNTKRQVWEDGFRIVNEKSVDSETTDSDGTLDLFIEAYDPSAAPLGNRLIPGQPNYVCFTILNLSREEECRLTYEQPNWSPRQKDILYTPYESLYDYALTPGPMEEQLNNPMGKFTTGVKNLIPVYPGEPIQFLARITPSEKFDGRTVEVTLPIMYTYDLKFEGKKYLKTFKSSGIFEIRSETAEEPVLTESGKSSQDTAEDGRVSADSEGGSIGDRIFIDTPLDRLGLYGGSDIDFNIVLINTTGYKLDNTHIGVVLKNSGGSFPIGEVQPGLVEEAWTTIPITLNRRTVLNHAAGASTNDLHFQVKYNVAWDNSYQTPDETGHIWENAFISPMEAACSGDHLEIGEFYNPVLDYQKTGILFSWKDAIYQPARCVGKDGNTLHHLWLDSQGNLVTDPQLINELFTVFMIFPHQESSDLRNQADTYRNYAQRYKADEERYADLSTFATGVQIASEIFSVALGVMYGDLSSAWTVLSGSISAFNAIDLYRNLMSMYTTDANISSEDIRQLLKQHRLDMGKEAINAAGHLANMESIWEVGMLIGKNLDLTQAMKTETNFLRRMTIKGKVSDLKTDIKKQSAGIGWSIFNYLEDTGGVAKGAIEFTILNKSAYMLNMQLANLFDLAAQKRITDPDELFMIGLYEQMLAKLRFDLADKLQAAIIARKKTMSGKIAIASQEWLYGTDFESELKRIKEDNLHLRNVLEESNRKKIIAIELEKRFTKRAIRRITENKY